MTPGIVPPRGNKHAVKQLHPSADVTFRPARCLLTEPDLALFAVLMESWELALKGGPAWEESWRSAGESLRAERARLRGILNTSSADKKHSLPYCSPPSLRFQSRHFPSVHYLPSPVCQWGCRCVALRDAYYRCRLCVSSVIARPFPTCTLIVGVVLGGLIVFPIKLFFFPDCLDSVWENPRERSLFCQVNHLLPQILPSALTRGSWWSVYLSVSRAKFALCQKLNWQQLMLLFLLNPIRAAGC